MKAPYQDLRERIFRDFWQRGQLRVGERLPTEHQLVARYKVSRPTISKSIAALAAEGWVTKRQGSGIFVAAVTKPPNGQNGSPQQRIGYIMETLQSAVTHRVFEGVEQVARTRDCCLEVACTNYRIEEEQRQIALMRERGIQGVVLYPTPHRSREGEYLACEFQDFPIVVVDMYQPSMRRPHLIFDNWSAGREMTRYLLGLGHKKIAFIKYQETMPHRAVNDRFAGYLRALEGAGQPLVEERMISYDADQRDPKLFLREFHRALDRFLALTPRPTALITTHDDHAHLAMAHLRARGVKVPQEVLVVGFDNVQPKSWGEKFPSTQPDFVAMGERAAEMLMECIASRDFSPTSVVLPCPVLPVERMEDMPRAGRSVPPNGTRLKKSRADKVQNRKGVMA